MSFLLLLLLCVGMVVLFVQRQRDREQLDQVLRRLAAIEAAPPAPMAPASVPAAVPAPVPETPAPPVAPVPAQDVEAGWSWEEEARHAAPVEQPREPRGPRTRSTLERIVAEHALALVGGVFVLAAAVFFVTYAIEQGWIGPWGRFALALGFAAALVVAAWRVASRLGPDERVGRAIGSLHGVLAATGAGVAFIAIVAAVRVQELFDASAGAALEMVVAAGVVLLARAWRSQDLAALGLGVGLAAPMLVGAEATGATVLLLAVALVAATALAVLEQWPRLLLGAALVTAPQLASFADGTDLATASPIVLAWWAVLAAGCVATVLRRAQDAPRSLVGTVFVAATVAASCIGIASESYASVDADGARVGVLLLLAALQVLVGAVLMRRDRDRHEILAAAFIGAGATVAAIAVADATDSAGRVAAWAAEAAVLTLLWERTRDRITAVFALLLAAASVLHVAFQDAPFWLLSGSRYGILDTAPQPFPTQSLLAVLAVAVAAFATRMLHGRLGAPARFVERASETLAAVALWYALAILVVHVAADGVPGSSTAWLVLACWAAVAVVLAGWLRTSAARPEIVFIGGFAALVQLGSISSTDHDLAAATCCFIAAATCAALAWQAASRRDARWVWAAGVLEGVLLAGVVVARVPPWNLWAWDAEPVGSAALHLALLVAATAALAFVARRLAGLDPRAGRIATLAFALAALYAISSLVVAAFTDVAGQLEQDAQVALTLTWVALGAGALFAGTSVRLRDHVELRIGGYALLALGAVKLVVADTAQLETPMRVLAFLATGLGLLGSAALEQRMRGDQR